MARAREEAKQGKAVVYVGMDIGLNKWVLCFSNGKKEVIKGIEASPSVASLLLLAKGAVRRLGATPEAVQLVCVQEAGRQGFAVHRELEANGVRSLVVDSSSIEVPRKFRHTKTDRIDAKALVRLLIRHQAGEVNALHVLQVPTVDEEDDRRPQREIHRLKQERTTQTNRIKGLLLLQGCRLGKIDSGFAAQVESARTFNGLPLPPNLKGEILRSFERFQVVDAQLKALRASRSRRARAEDARQHGRTVQRRKAPATTQPDATAAKVMHLQKLNGVGEESSWLLVTEFFGWRKFASRREVGAAGGLTPTVHESSTISRQQGISKSGNPRVRWMMLELAWCWLRFQPDSKLSHWYWERFGHGSSRQRKTGIVAVARRLLIDLWRFVEKGVVPEGAILRG